MSELRDLKKEISINEIEDGFINQVTLNAEQPQIDGDEKIAVVTTYSAEQIRQLIERIKGL